MAGDGTLRMCLELSANWASFAMLLGVVRAGRQNVRVARLLQRIGAFIRLNSRCTNLCDADSRSKIETQAILRVFADIIQDRAKAPVKGIKHPSLYIPRATVSSR
jgi:hypothetical protein